MDHQTNCPSLIENVILREHASEWYKSLQNREVVGRGGGTSSLPCLIVNAPNRNEAGIPALTHQDRPIAVYTVLVRVYRRSSAMVSGRKEYVIELFSSFEWQISRNWVVHISWVKAGFYEKLILKTVIQKSELEKFKIKNKRKQKGTSMSPVC